MRLIKYFQVQLLNAVMVNLNLVGKKTKKNVEWKNTENKMSKNKNVEREKYRKSVLPTIKRKYIVVLFLLKIFYFTMRNLEGEGEGEGVGDVYSRLTFTLTLKSLFYRQVGCRSHNQFLLFTEYCIKFTRTRFVYLFNCL